MAFDIDKLNPEQREAVEAIHGPVLILAGAGTGKTRTVTCRIAYMIEQDIRPESILAVTFTNKAAAEMRERVADMITTKAARAMTICTFHSLCVRLLRQDIDKVGYKKNFSIITASDQSALIKQLIVKKAGNEKIKPAQIISVISSAKSASLPLSEIEDALFADIAVAYQKELRARNALDFDDLLIVAEELLSKHEEVRYKFREYFRYVTVDEFQDTNSQQMRLLQHLVGIPYNICVVGDDDQSIYGWRGADVTNILQFEQFFPDPKVIRLEANYRSNQHILTLANATIKNNPNRREKALRAMRQGGELPRLISMTGDKEEAEFVANEIKERHLDFEIPWENFAVLFRTNTQIRKMEEAMREEEIPYRLVGAQSFYDRREIKDLLAYLEVLVDGTADVPLLRIMNTPPRGIGVNTTMMLVDEARERNKSVWEVMLNESFIAGLTSKTQGAINTFVDFILELQESLDENLPIEELFEKLLESSNYLEWIKGTCKTEAEKNQRGEAIDELKQSLVRVEPGLNALRDYIDKTTLDSDKDDDDLDSKPGVTLITLHASKGLEYPNVYLVGLENGFLPHQRSLDEGTVDEERRLFYVGITRAKDDLCMTYCSTRKKWGEEHHCEPSAFIPELPEDGYVFSDHAELMAAVADEDEMAALFRDMRS